MGDEKRVSELAQAYRYGIDHGLLLAEQERDSEDLADAMGCMVVSDKCSMPSAIAKRRQPHSRAWRDTMAGSMVKFIKLVADKE